MTVLVVNKHRFVSFV